jgi:serine/threonine protein kinase
MKSLFLLIQFVLSVKLQLSKECQYKLQLEDQIHSISTDMWKNKYMMKDDLTSGHECMVLLFQNNQKPPTFMINKFARPGEPDGITEILNEKRIFETLSCIKNYKDYIIGYYGSKIIDGTTVLQIEYAPEKNLWHYLNNNINLSKSDLVTMAYELVEAVLFLHTNHIIHWGLFPRNIFIKKNGQLVKPVLGDFGKSFDYSKYLSKFNDPITLKKERVEIFQHENKQVLDIIYYILSRAVPIENIKSFKSHIDSINDDYDNIGLITLDIFSAIENHFIRQICDVCGFIPLLSYDEPSSDKYYLPIFGKPTDNQ